MPENERYLLGLDFGTLSARGVLLNERNGEQVTSSEYSYPQGIIQHQLKNGKSIDKKFILQDAHDYLEVCEKILKELANNKNIVSIGLCFTASSPMPVDQNGLPLSVSYPENPHAYVKLWKHASDQKYIRQVEDNCQPFLDNFGGRISGEWLLAKAAEMQAEAPLLWQACDKFIEAGDWLVWQLCGVEKRSMDFATFKAQFQNVASKNNDQDGQYPVYVVNGLESRLSTPFNIGTAAGSISSKWREKINIKGSAIIAVAVIDSHAILPATGHVESGSFVGALGTSAVYLQLSEDYHPLPMGIEGMAKNAALENLWCYEAGQAAFGDTLAWFLKSVLEKEETDVTQQFNRFNALAAELKPSETSLMAIDWWHGNRVPFADNHLNGMLIGLKTTTTSVEIYRALMESICFGAKQIRDLFIDGNINAERVIMASGLARKNPVLIQMMSDIFAQPIEVPLIENGTAVGAAIHGALAGGIVNDFGEGAVRYGAKKFQCYQPNALNLKAYEKRYQIYLSLIHNDNIKHAMHKLYEQNHTTEKTFNHPVLEDYIPTEKLSSSNQTDVI